MIIVKLCRFDTPTEEKDANSIFKITSKEKPFYKYQFKSRDEIPNKAEFPEPHGPCNSCISVLGQSTDL